MTKSTDTTENGENPNLIDIRIINGSAETEDDSEEDSGENNLDLPKISAVDGGYGWIIVLACWLMHVLVGGWNRGYGVMYVEFRHRFQSSAAITAWVGGACAAARMAFSPVATTLSNRFSSRNVVFCGGILLGVSAVLNGFAPNIYYLFLTHSVLGGFGGSLVYAPCIIMVSQYFEKRRNLALGIATSGSGLGLFLFPPLMELFFVHYGYMGTMLLGGAFMFNNSISGALLRPLIQSQPLSIRLAHKKAKDTLKANKQKQKSDLKKYLDLNLWHEPSFLLFVLSLAFATSCYFSTQYLIVDMAHSRGVSLSNGSFLLSAVGIMDMLTRVSSGLVFGYCHRRQQFLYNFALLLNGISALLCIVASSFAWFMVVAVVHGMACGIITAQRAAMVADLVGVARVSSSFGLTVFVQGVGLVAGPAFAGYLRDLTGGYLWSYVFIGLCGLTSASLYFINLRCFYHRRPQATRDSSMDIVVTEEKKKMGSMVSIHSDVG